ncbi:MAG: TonB-dependent receptor family protein, partial [Bacteroidales bacterium]|nr:TonB-dependent receptor family protein [Bacteroidales bacterium]
GFYGTVTAMASTRGGGTGVSASLQKGKLSASINANAVYNVSNGTTSDSERTQDSGFSTSTHTTSDMSMPAAMVNASVSYDIDTLNLVSATVGVMHFGMKNSSGITNTIFTAPGADPFGYTGTTQSVNNRTSLSLGADYQHLWADVPGRSLVLSYQFNGAPSVNNSINTFDGSTIAGFDLTDRKSLGNTGSTDHTFQADFTTPLGSAVTLSAGAKYIYRHNSSDQTDYLWNGTSFVENAASSLQYDFYNRIGAAYTELDTKLGNWGLKAGVRYEHTWQTYNSTAMTNPFSVNYGNLVPSASIQWSPSMTQNIGLSYNMRISRPGISYLNPYVDTSDPTALSYGNSDLETEKGHNISLVYNYYSSKVMVSATLRHSYTGNGISAYSFYDSNNLLNTTYGNIVTSRSTGLNGYVMFMPGSKTRIMLNGGVSYDDLSSATLGQANSGWSYNLMGGVQQTLPADFRLSANVIMMGSRTSLQGYSSGMRAGILGVTKTFLDDRLSLSLNGILPLMKGLEMNMESYTKGNGFTSYSSTQIPMKAITFQISWTFGKQGNYAAKKARRSIENESQLNSSTTAESMSGIMGM